MIYQARASAVSVIRNVTSVDLCKLHGCARWFYFNYGASSFVDIRIGCIDNTRRENREGENKTRKRTADGRDGSGAQTATATRTRLLSVVVVVVGIVRLAHIVTIIWPS